ncbi:MAG TPA: hypothetical protein VFK51_05665 [Burkholderiales bacterium]|jgi:hypothetical protein|nr:hypothetical protein [Burkholderiales bacterium]
MKCRAKTGLSATLIVLVWAPAFAADDERLVRILERADVADNFAFYCAQYDPSIIDRTRSTVGDMRGLMLHIRSEVIPGLPESEARRIAVRSANAARKGALLAIRKHYSPGPREERARLHEWCEKSVVPSLKEFVVRHDEHHAVLDQAIRKAKQGR